MFRDIISILMLFLFTFTAMAIDGSKINEVVRHIVRKLRQSEKLPSYNYCVVVRLHFWGGHTFNYKQ